VGSEPSTSPRFFYLKEDVFQSRYDTDAETVEPVNLGEAPIAHGAAILSGC